MSTPNPTQLAKRYFEEASQAVEACKGTPRVLGLIASTDKPSMAYANATKQRFLNVGMEYTLEQVSRLDLEAYSRSQRGHPHSRNIYLLPRVRQSAG